MIGKICIFLTGLGPRGQNKDLHDLIRYFRKKQLVKLWLISLSSSTKSSTCSFIHSTRLTMCNVCSIQLCAKIQKKYTGKLSDLQTKHRKCKFSIYRCIGSVATYAPIPKWQWFKTATEWLSLQCPQTPKANSAWPCPPWAQNGQHRSRLGGFDPQ